MCFYDQYQFTCGDSKFGHFRRRCNRVYSPGRSCGLKRANEVFHVQKKCSLCETIATKRHGQQQEWDRIDIWESKEQVDDKGVQRSIGIINQLQHEILALELQRRQRRITAREDNLENNGSASLGSVAENADLLARSTASIVAKASPLQPLDKLEEEDERHLSPPEASPSAIRRSDDLQPPEWEAHQLSLSSKRSSKDFEVSVTQTSQGNQAEDVTDILDNWFKEHLAHPFPSEDEKEQLCSSTSLSKTQVRMKWPP